MTYSAKYITYEDQYGSTVAVIFSIGQIHKEFALDLGIERKLVSAGFLSVDKHGVWVHGKSESLGLQVKPNDSIIIARMLGYKA